MEAKAVLAFLTPGALESSWVEREISGALVAGKLIPLALAPVAQISLPQRFRTVHIPEFDPGDEHDWGMLLSALERKGIAVRNT
jgi:hypothetical protein